MLDTKTQSPMGASLELQNTCPIQPGIKKNKTVLIQHNPD